MKLDATVMRNLSKSDFRVLTSIETCMQTHYLVPSTLIASVASLRHGGIHKCLSTLLRDNLISHDQSCGYDGYRLTNSGYDILALHNLKTRGIIVALGDKIGTGKESDVYIGLALDEEKQATKQVVLKFHRLGRTSFRNIKKKRDYFQINNTQTQRKKGGGVTNRSKHYDNWLFLSRVSAVKEYAFMKALHDVNYPTPTPIGHNRHIVVMSLVRGMPLYQINAHRVSAEQSESIFAQTMVFAKRLAEHGLVHCDLNEFNLMVDMSGGVQEEVCEDYYVRHSGMESVVPGALSAHVPVVGMDVDGTGELIVEEPSAPKRLLDNGDPYPNVTLIDFPQMVSTSHPNAKELYLRDCMSLKLFFEKKLKCIPVNGWDEVMPQWEDVIVSQESDGCDDAKIAGKVQTRLDQQLQASGYSEEDAARDMQLYYHSNIQSSELEPILDGQINEGRSEEEGDEEDDDFEEKSLSSSDSNNVDQETLYSKNTQLTTSSNMSTKQKAKLRVKHHASEQRKRSSRSGAFKKRNYNKNFDLGKRSHKEQF